MLSEHVEHGAWEKVGRCVYCKCGTRLYQGAVPKTDKKRQELAESLDAVAEALAKVFDTARLEECETCGAAHYGNAMCLTCHQHWPWHKSEDCRICQEASAVQHEGDV